jgi:hypothetical protein
VVPAMVVSMTAATVITGQRVFIAGVMVAFR